MVKVPASGDDGNGEGARLGALERDLARLDADQGLLHLDEGCVHEFEGAAIHGARTLDGDDVSRFDTEGIPATGVLGILPLRIEQAIDIDGAGLVLDIQVAVIRIDDGGHGTADAEGLAVVARHHFRDRGDRSLIGARSGLDHGEALLAAAHVHHEVGRPRGRAGVRVRREHDAGDLGTAAARGDGEPLGNGGVIEGPLGRRLDGGIGNAAFQGDAQIGILHLEAVQGGDDLLLHAAGGERRTGEDGKEESVEFHIVACLEVS